MEQGELGAPVAAYLLVLLHRGGQGKPVRHAGDHGQQHHLPWLGWPGRLSHCSFFSRGSQLHLRLSSPPASCWRLRFPLRWTETASELSTTGPSNWLPTENHNHWNFSSAVIPPTKSRPRLSIFILSLSGVSGRGGILKLKRARKVTESELLGEWSMKQLLSYIFSDSFFF